jgi:hypothetical protein
MRNRYILYYSYSSITKCSTVVQVPWLPEVASLRCAHAQPEVAQYPPLVGPFDWKWRYETSPRSDPTSPDGGGRGVRMRNRKLHNIRPSGALWPEMTSPVGFPWKIWERACATGIAIGCSLGRPRLSFSSLGYLPVLFSYNIIYFNNSFHLQWGSKEEEGGIYFLNETSACGRLHKKRFYLIWFDLLCLTTFSYIIAASQF